MEYTSQYLSHFVGTAHRQTGETLSLDEQYTRLASVIRSGCLSSNARELSEGEYACNEGYAGVRIDPYAKFSDDAMYVQWAVSFCDIPDEGLQLHARKYGQFGIGFPKSFLVPKGASPLFYVATDARGLKGMSRAEYFDARLAHYVALRDYIDRHRPELMRDPLAAPIVEPWYYLRSLLDFMVLGFLKRFDSSLADDARDNSYMEREWRVLGDVGFKPVNVARVYVAPGYERKVKADFPALADSVVVVRLQ